MAHVGDVFQLKIPDPIKKALIGVKADNIRNDVDEDMTDVILQGLLRELKRRGVKIPKNDYGI